MISYAQNFEDVILARVFGPRRSGFYVDVGAGDPDHMSVTKWFYEQGWKGINVEPNREFFRRLLACRPRDVSLNIGASDASGFLTFTEMPAAELSTFVDQPDVAQSGTRRTVQVATLNEILETNAGMKPIDFLKVDVEGWEAHVLRGLDLRHFRPSVMLIESVLPESRIESHESWEHLVTASGYSMVYFDGLNRFYLAEEKADLVQAFALPPNVFDEVTPSEVVVLSHRLNLLTETVRKLAHSVVPDVSVSPTPAVGEVINLIAEIKRRAGIVDSQQSRILRACQLLMDALGTDQQLITSGGPPGTVDDALNAIALAAQALANAPSLPATDEEADSS